MQKIDDPYGEQNVWIMPDERMKDSKDKRREAMGVCGSLRLLSHRLSQMLAVWWY